MQSKRWKRKVCRCAQDSDKSREKRYLNILNVQSEYPRNKHLEHLQDYNRNTIYIAVPSLYPAILPQYTSLDTSHSCSYNA
jgi:hypothetical protein